MRHLQQRARRAPGVPQRRAAARRQRPRVARGRQGLQASSVVDARVSEKRRVHRPYQGECTPVQGPIKQASTAVMPMLSATVCSACIWVLHGSLVAHWPRHALASQLTREPFSSGLAKLVASRASACKGLPTSRRWRRPRATSEGSSGAASCTSSGGRAASMLKLKSAHRSYSPSRTSRQVCSRTTASAACSRYAERSDLTRYSGALGSASCMHLSQHR
jgi:hypothetical protein